MDDSRPHNCLDQIVIVLDHALFGVVLVVADCKLGSSVVGGSFAEFVLAFR